ncbi:MAG: histidine phosphatase family protein [Bryobacteraceae bacterium]|nr:histidine phosphatase family protein [Bryobacteraceae bacterium]
MTTFLLIRHGHTSWVGKALAGHLPGVALSASGHEQAENLVRRLHGTSVSAVYSSPLQRTLETAAPLARSIGVTVIQRPRLIEINFGDWTGRTISELAADEGWNRFNALRSITRIPNGDLMLDVQARMVDELMELHQAHPNQTVAIFSHQDTIKAALAHFLGISLDNFLRFQVDPVAISTVQIAEGGARVLTLNSTGAL